MHFCYSMGKQQGRSMILYVCHPTLLNHRLMYKLPPLRIIIIQRYIFVQHQNNSRDNKFPTILPSDFFSLTIYSINYKIWSTEPHMHASTIAQLDILHYSHVGCKPQIENWGSPRTDLYNTNAKGSTHLPSSTCTSM